MSRLAFCTRTILLDPDDLAAVRRHVEIAGDEEVGVRTFLAELTGELEGLRVQLGAQGFDVAVQRRSAPEEPPALIATSLQTGKTSRIDLKKPAKEREAETGDLFGGTAPTAPAEAARNWQAEGEAAFKAGKSRMVPADIWKGVSAKEGNKRADAWFKGRDRANLAAPVAAAPPKRLTPVATREQFIADMMAGGRVTAKGRTFSLKDRGKLGWTVIEHNDGYNVEKGPGPMETWAKGFAAERAAEEVGLTPGTQQEQIATAPKEGIENGPAAGTGLREGSPAVSGTEQPGSAGAAAGSPGLSGTDGTGRGADAPAAFGPDAGGNQQPVQGPAGGDAGQVAGTGSDSGSGGRNRDDRADTAAVANNVEAGREIALPPNYRITEDDHIGEGGPKAKVAANLEALRLLKVLEAENRKATPSEQAVLVRYVGWGAFAQDMFQDAKPEWARERAELKGLLTTEEYESARASVLNAHYTSPEVIKGMWAAMEYLGFTGGRAIEPASGVGHFIGMTPAALRDKVKWTATELDKVTGAIAQQLYQRADVNVQGFETLNRPNGFYDVAISNVPFGSFNIRDLRYKDEYLIHDYFFIRALDLVRPGGIVAFITSSGTMDKANDSARAEIMKRADLLGAIRLPGGKRGAFAGNAGTEVTTDILFLRRKGQGLASVATEWQNLKEIQTPDGPTRINEYFASRPEMMLGQMRLIGSMYRDKSPVLEGDATNLEGKIMEAARQMPANSFIRTEGAPRAEAQVMDKETSGRTKEGAFYLEGDKVMRKVLGLGTDPGLSAVDQDKVRRLVAMRDTVNDLLRVGRDRSGDAVARQRLNTLYDAFVKKYGPINRETVTTTSRLNKAGENIVIRRLPNMSAFRADPDAYKVAAIENYDAEKDTATKAALFSGEVVSDSPATELKNSIDGIGWSLNAFGELNLTAIGDKIGKSKQQVIDELGDRIFLNPNGDRWEPAEQYLAGDVVEKLDEARAAAEADRAYERNVAALEAVQPVALTQEEITVPFGAPWVPASVYEQFLQEVIGTEGKARVSLNPVTKQYALAGVNFSLSAQTQFGTSKVNVAEIISHALAMKTPRVTNTVRTETGTREEVDEEATREAQVKTQLVRKTFEGDIEAGSEGWVWQDTDRGELLAKLYNRKFNRLVQQRFDGSHLTFPGLATKITDGSGNVIPFSLRQHQKDSVWRIVQNGNTLLDHVVGAGKTFTMIAGAMEMKRLGQIQRPMFVVPNHMLEQFSREFLQAYPNANILVAQKDEMTRANRKAFAAKIAAERWDGIVITHDAFGRLPLSKDVYVKFMKDEIAEIESAIRHMKAMQNKKDPTVKQLEQMKKRAETRMEKLIAAERKDEGVLFEELGVDQLIVDEAHLFKNLAFYTQHTRVKGLAQGASQRAMDLFLKVRELEKSRPGRSSIFATGTPISNTMAEMYTMQRYLQLDELVKLGVDRFDAWAATYGEIRTNMELSPDGRTFRETSSFSRFRNLPELVALYSKMADTKTADMLNLPRPKLAGGKPIIVEAEPSAAEENYILSLVKRAEEVRGKKAEKGGDNMLKVVSEGRKVALDYRLINPDYGDMNPSGKVAKLVNNVARIWRDGNDDPVAKAQLIFSDMGVPFTEQAAPPPRPESEVDPDEVIDDDADAEEVSADESEALRSRYNLYEEIRRQLVARGIPKQQVSFIHEAKDDSKKAALFEKVRRGEVRVLIGSTGKMGVGTNVQKRLKAMHHLDAPWKPAEVEQRDGRILRQGNMNPEVEIYRYITKRSFDSFMWQTLERKANFIAQIKAGARGVRVAEDIDSPLPEAAELKAAASGDPRIMQHAELTKEVRDLEAQFSSHVRTIGQARRDVSLRQEELSGLEKRLPKVLEDAAKVPVTAGDNFKVELLVGPMGTFTKRAEAGAVVAAFLAEQGSLPSKGVSKVTVARFNGLDIVVTIDTRQDPLALSMAVNGYNGRGVQFGLAPDRTPQLDAALMSRMESELADIPALKGHIEYRIEQIRKELPKIEAAAADRPFPRMERLREAKQELSDLTKALSEDKNKKPPAGPTVMGSAAEGLPLFETQGKLPPTQFIATRAQINAAAKEVDRLTQQMLGRKVKTFTNDVMPSFIPPEFIAAYGEHNRTIYVTMRAAHDLANNVGHESLHAMRQLGLISENEWTAMTAMAKKHGFSPTPTSLALYRREYVGKFGLTEAEFADKIDEESVARLFGNYVATREKLTPFVRRVIDKLREWADAVLTAIGVAGVEIRARDFMARAYRGDVGNRPEGSGAMALDQLAVAGAVSEVTQTPEFKRWFGESKVVDADGKPLVMYHVGNKDIEAFRGMPTSSGLIYFNKDPSGAKAAARNKDAQYAVYIKAETPFNTPENPLPWHEAETRGARIKGDGYDAIYVKDEGGVSLAVFEPTQIKSVFNSGAFDPANPMILGNAPDGSAGGGAPAPSAVAVDAEAQAEMDKYTASINLHHLTTSDAIKRFLVETTRAAGKFTTERRGTISHEQTIAMAEELGLTEAQLLSRKTGDMWNNAYIFAARTLMVKSAERVLRLAKRAMTTNSRADLGSVLWAVQRHLAIQEQVAGLATEAGRALDQFNIAAAKDFGTAIDHILHGARTNVAGVIATMGGEEALARELVGMIAQLDDPSQVSKFLAKAYKATALDMVREFWVAGLLSGLRTFTTNLIGNLGAAMWQIPTTAVAAGIGAVRGGENRVRFAEVTARMNGLVAGSWEGAYLAWKYLKTGDSKSPMTRLDLQHREAIPGKLGYLVRTPFRVMEGGDQLFKEMNRRAALYALATRQAMKEQHKGQALQDRIGEIVASPSVSMRREAWDEALYGTFQRDLGPIGRMVTNLREVIPGAWLIAPFIKTGANLGKVAVENTPAAALSLLLPNRLKSQVKANLLGQNGQAAQDTQLARIAMGTGLVVGVVAMVAAGMLTGGGPDDPDERAIWLAAGNQPYSVKVNGTWYSYQRIDWFALVIGTTADFVEASADMTDKAYDEVAAIILYSIANVTRDKSWFKQPAEFFDAFFGKTSSVKTMQRYVRGIASSFAVPNIVNQFAQNQDPVLRDAQTMWDEVKKRLPYKRQSLLPRRTIFGEPKSNEGSLGPDLLSPIWTTTQKDDPVLNELLALKYFPSMPARVVNGHKLTPEQYDRYVETSGKDARARMDKLLARKNWTDLSDDRRIDMIATEFREARDRAREALKREWPDLRKKAGAE